MKIALVVGARPNFMKVGPVYFELKKHSRYTPLLIHTGQHYDKNLSEIFFTQLGFPKPDVYLGVGSGTHGVQTAKIMIAFEQFLLQEKPDLVLVAGDVNSTVACAIDAVKLHIPVAHLEAGLRSYDRRMPEEINRIQTDCISSMLLTPSQDADENLIREGISKDKIFLVGNAMIDSLMQHEKKAELSTKMNDLGLKKHSYALITLHRPSNVDDRENLEIILDAFAEIAEKIPLVFPMHPRTRKQLAVLDLEEKANAIANLKIIEPIGYLDFLKLEKYAKFVLTDSGGIQEETTVLQVPCLTLRENTERPITIELGTNQLVELDRDVIIQKVNTILNGHYKKGSIPPLWDGHTAERIVQVMDKFNYSFS
ncbi:MAG: UDP-N-acetylglucosamine 2-epimerase (non-hydrolyzing) [Candidatus Cloacimonetes bacterium]|nr:UDP-N-acetylglucosamine 2-epimerase (non-hydrolyzing) [Candidatus Cloacimonadota bacterium]